MGGDRTSKSPKNSARIFQPRTSPMMCVYMLLYKSVGFSYFSVLYGPHQRMVTPNQRDSTQSPKFNLKLSPPVCGWSIDQCSHSLWCIVEPPPFAVHNCGAIICVILTRPLWRTKALRSNRILGPPLFHRGWGWVYISLSVGLWCVGGLSSTYLRVRMHWNYTTY